MTATEDRLAYALDSAMDNLEFALDATSIDFEVATSPNTNQYIVFFAEGEQLAYVTAELSRYGEPTIFVDIYRVAADGGERWVCGDMSVDAAILYIIEN
jgi:hypothetical protein|nr:MAG TPA: hypothetical protein [Caudoviricetes sp.]